MVWYSHPFKNFTQFVMIHTVKCFSVANETEVDVFLEFPALLALYPWATHSLFYLRFSCLYKRQYPLSYKVVVEQMEFFKVEKSPCVYSIDDHQMFLSFPKV